MVATYDIGRIKRSSYVKYQRTRDQILTSIYSMIKDVYQAVRERSRSNEQIIFTPQLVFVITDMSLIIDHVILQM